MFHLFFRRMLQACFFGCYICFHTYVASVLSRCCVCLQLVSSVFVSVSSVFFYMLQVLHLNVSKLDHVLHMEYAWEARGARAVPRARGAGPRVATRRRCGRAKAGQCGPMRGCGKTDCNRGRPSEHQDDRSVVFLVLLSFN
jgi:hypothetical protein